MHDIDYAYYFTSLRWPFGHRVGATGAATRSARLDVPRTGIVYILASRARARASTVEWRALVRVSCKCKLCDTPIDARENIRRKGAEKCSQAGDVSVVPPRPPASAVRSHVTTSA